jgi:AmpD protein
VQQQAKYWLKRWEMINKEGWLSEAEKHISPNFDKRPINSEIKLIVIHNISLPPENFEPENVKKLFKNELDFETHEFFYTIKDLKVSSHFVIDRTGKIYQFVSVYDRAWHAGVSSFKSQENCNDFSLGIELIGSDNAPFEDIQYDALNKLIETLCSSFPKIKKENIVGHSEIAPGRKTDPGPFFDWSKIS